jgi:hypothetical protein
MEIHTQLSSRLDFQADLQISGIRARLGKQLNEELVEKMTSLVRDGSKSFSGECSFKGAFRFTPDRPTELFFNFDNRRQLDWSQPNSWAPYIRELFAVLDYFFGRQDEEAGVTMPNGDELIFRSDGTWWPFYSAASDLQYNGPDDLVGMHRTC